VDHIEPNTTDEEIKLCIFDALECPSSNPMHDARQQVHGALVASVKELAGNRDLGALFDEIARSLAVPEKAEPGRPRDDPRPGPQQPFD
jgi:hypothetical protein